MSRVGKKPILIPENVEVKIEGQKVIVNGPKGELQKEFRPEFSIEVREGKIFVTPQTETKQTNALWGLTRALLANMIKGVKEGFEKKLEIQGVGFRANIEGEGLILYVGFSHAVKIEGFPGIKFSVDKNIITVSGIDIGRVSQIAANVKKAKPPEPYKGTGIRYLGEQIRKKMGKKAVTTTG